MLADQPIRATFYGFSESLKPRVRRGEYPHIPHSSPLSRKGHRKSKRTWMPGE